MTGAASGHLEVPVGDTEATEATDNRSDAGTDARTDFPEDEAR